jgi:Glyoxalase-like domain
MTLHETDRRRQARQTSTDGLDHVLVGAASLASCLSFATASLQVTPLPGGRHPDLGTHNALIGLTSGAYVELIAPEPDSARSSGIRSNLSRFEGPALYGWCWRRRDLDPPRRALLRSGFAVSDVLLRRRRTPDGDEICWRYFHIDDPTVHTVAPLVIDWMETPHPSSRAPMGGDIRRLSINHPRPTRVSEMLRLIGVADWVGVNVGETPSITIDLVQHNVSTTLATPAFMACVATMWE